MRWAKESTFDLKLLANFRGYIFSGIGWNSLMCLWKSSYDCLACASSVRRAAAWGCSASNASTSFSQPVKSSIRIYKWLSIFFRFFLISSFVFSSVSTYILLYLSCLGLPLCFLLVYRDGLSTDDESYPFAFTYIPSILLCVSTKQDRRWSVRKPRSERASKCFKYQDQIWGFFPMSLVLCPHWAPCQTPKPYIYCKNNGLPSSSSPLCSQEEVNDGKKMRILFNRQKSKYGARQNDSCIWRSTLWITHHLGQANFFRVIPVGNHLLYMIGSFKSSFEFCLHILT